MKTTLIVLAVLAAIVAAGYIGYKVNAKKVADAAGTKPTDAGKDRTDATPIK